MVDTGTETRAEPRGEALNLGSNPIAAARSTELPAPPSIAELAPFRTLDSRLIQRLAQEIEWFSVPSGWTLLRAGDRTDRLYVVTSGVLGVVVGSGEQRELVAEIRAGEATGEMSLVTGEPHSATVVALRHTEIVALAKPAYDRLILEAPEFLHWITRLVVDRLRRTTFARRPDRRHRAIALVPQDNGVDLARWAVALTGALARQSCPAHCFAPEDAERPVGWFNEIEARQALTLYRANPIERGLDAWSRFCIHQADRVILVRNAGPGPTLYPADDFSRRPGQSETRLRRAELVVLHAENAPDPPAPPDLPAPIEGVFHLRAGHPGDVARLARHLSGRSIGLVLSGGAARSFAHIGAVRALREVGIPFDRIGGCSMGAIIAAGVAAEWDDREIRERLHDCFVAANPLNDYTVPWVALFRGRSVDRMLARHFEARAIEGLWRPYFCVSSNLTSGRLTVHRQGSIARALRASIAIPGVLPPVIERGEVLVDGGVMNTFPTDIMSRGEEGPIVGVNVASDIALRPGPQARPRRGLWRRSGRHANADADAAAEPTPPGIVSVLMYTGTISSSLQLALCRSQTSLLIEPPMAQIRLLDWHSFEQAIEAGYRHTSEVLARADLGALVQIEV